MKPYIGVVHQDGGSAYGIAFPDAPGCFSAADTLDDLFVMADEALGLWLEVAAEDQVAVPVPRDLSDIKHDPEWAEAFADAVLVIAVPSPALRLQAAA